MAGKSIRKTIGMADPIKPKPYSYKTVIKIWDDYFNFYKELAELFDCEMTDRVTAADDHAYSLEEANRCNRKRIERFDTRKQRQLRATVLQTLSSFGVSFADFIACDDTLKELASPMFGNKGDKFVKEYGMTINTDDELTYRLRRQLDRLSDLRIAYIDNKTVNPKAQKRPKLKKSKGKVGRPPISERQRNLYKLLLLECENQPSTKDALTALKGNQDIVEACMKLRKELDKKLIAAAQKWHRDEQRRKAIPATKLKHR